MSCLPRGKPYTSRAWDSALTATNSASLGVQKQGCLFPLGNKDALGEGPRGGALVSTSTFKELGSHCSCPGNKKKLNKLKIRGAGTHQRTEQSRCVCGVRATVTGGCVRTVLRGRAPGRQPGPHTSEFPPGTPPGLQDKVRARPLRPLQQGAWPALGKVPGVPAGRGCT